VAINVTHVVSTKEYYEAISGVGENRHVFGWFEDGGFQLFHYLFEDDQYYKIRLSANQMAVCGKENVSGSFEEWKRLEALARKNDLFSFCILLSLAAPLFYLTQTNGAIIFITGPTGVGKTTALRVALTVYGDPDGLIYSGNSTPGSIGRILSILRHLPLVVDDITAYKTTAPELILTIANGISRKFVQKLINTNMTWNSISMITSNDDISKFEIPNAPQLAVRIIKINMKKPVAPSDALTMYQLMRENYGTAGMRWIHYVMMHREEITNDLYKTILKLQKEWPNEYRYYVWTLAACLVAGKHAKKIGIISSQYRRILNSIILQLKEKNYVTF